MKWTPTEIAKYKENILTEIGIEGLSIRRVCQIPGFPSIYTFYEWLKEDPEFAKQYARACEARADKIADEILEIADDSSQDSITTENGEIENREFVNRSKVRIDARKWLLSKLHPKKYGDKLDITSGDEPINKSVEVVVVRPKD